jgi:carbon monoxide dehydrogenase subunit G
VGRIGGSASIEVDAPIEAVWELIEDVEIAPIWQGGLDAMTPLEHDDQGRATLCETETDAKVRTVKSKVRFAYEPPTRLSWTQEKGDLKSLVGSWQLEELEGGRTRATYSLDGDPGRVLGMLIRGPVEGKIRDLLVSARPGELKARIEGS